MWYHSNCVTYENILYYGMVLFLIMLVGGLCEIVLCRDLTETAEEPGGKAYFIVFFKSDHFKLNKNFPDNPYNYQVVIIIRQRILLKSIFLFSVYNFLALLVC